MVIKARIPPHHPRLYQFTILKHIEIHGYKYNLVHIAINIISLSIYIYTQSPCTKLYLLLYSCVEDHSQKSPQFFDL